MDGSEKLCFNKVLSQLSDITDKLSGGVLNYGMEL